MLVEGTVGLTGAVSNIEDYLINLTATQVNFPANYRFILQHMFNLTLNSEIFGFLVGIGFLFFIYTPCSPVKPIPPENPNISEFKVSIADWTSVEDKPVIGWNAYLVAVRLIK